MASTSVSVTIHRPPEDVFAVLTDPTLSPKWSANVVKGELITPGSPAIGSRRRAAVKSPFGRGTTESVMEVTDLEPNRMVALKLVESPIAGEARRSNSRTRPRLYERGGAVSQSMACPNRAAYNASASIRSFRLSRSL